MREVPSEGVYALMQFSFLCAVVDANVLCLTCASKQEHVLLML